MAPTLQSCCSTDHYTTTITGDDNYSLPLILSPCGDEQPQALSAAVELLPQRLYWLSGVHDVANAVVVNVDHELVYDPFCEDFGPLNLAKTYRYFQLMHSKLSSPLLASKRIVHCTSSCPEKRANGAYLMSSFLAVILGWDLQAATAPFEALQPPLLPFRDATYGPCFFPLTASDCVGGLLKAKTLGWFNASSFDVESYEFLERPENGDLSWVIPNKFVAFSGPEKAPKGGDPAIVYLCLAPDVYVPIFKQLGVKLVVRLNRKEYASEEFTAHGFQHAELYFMDGSAPSREIVYRFLELCESEPGVVAVHCKAGLGRTGTLIGCYAIKHYGFTANQWIAWNRICRPGSVLGPQQQFLCEIQTELRESAHVDL